MYRGRFAPSPTGPLHFGSLITAVGSFLEAKTRGGEWLVRMEDIDAPRVVAGAADTLLRTLDAFDLTRDGEVLYQSQRSEAYTDAIEQLQARGALYGCACTRREIADASTSAFTGIDGLVYPGACRDGVPLGRMARATRVRTQGAQITFGDAVQGVITQNVEHAVGDFVVARADGFTAYQLAVVVDDAAQGITHVVRGADLLESTPRQIMLQRQLNLPTPHYAHLPVVLNAQGEKLSKQTRAQPIDAGRPVLALVNALRFLGQAPPAALQQASVAELWVWALYHWRIDRVPAVRGAAATNDAAVMAFGGA